MPAEMPVNRRYLSFVLRDNHCSYASLVKQVMQSESFKEAAEEELNSQGEAY
jgi:thioredoxin-related protein